MGFAINRLARNILIKLSSALLTLVEIVPELAYCLHVLVAAPGTLDTPKAAYGLPLGLPFLPVLWPMEVVESFDYFRYSWHKILVSPTGFAPVFSL